PSFYEVCNTSTSSTYTNSTTSYTGQWGLNSTDRSFDSSTSYSGSTTSTGCWLRSGYSSDPIYIRSSGEASNFSSIDPFGVRPAAHLSLSSIYSLTKYLIIFNSNGGSSCASIKVESVSNATYGTIPTPTRTGYTFEGWYKNSDFSGNKVSASDIVTEDHTLYAKWVKGNISVTGSSTLLSNGIVNDATGAYTYYLIPQTGHYVSEFSFDNSTFYAVDSYFGTIANFEFAAKVEYMVSTFNNQFTLELKGMPIGYTGTINIYLKTTATPYENLKEGGGSSVSGISVTSTKGGTAYIVGDDFESLADTDTVTIATKVSLSGYTFSHWEDMNGNNLGVEMSIRLQKAVIMDNVITAVYVENNENINNSLDN
ncbi:MAG: InlB B-repeat-containing protein, partial [Clostridia bacterium]|nr:InlB B-repeat-containing protein [Clostridia bacterium]